MSVVLLDTSVTSLLHPRKKADALRAWYDPHMRGRTLAISFQTVAELWDWAENNKWGDKAREGLDAFVRRFLVIPYDYELAKTWARVMSSARTNGRRLEAGDCWIAATAVHRGIPLLTHDRHMVGRTISGLDVVTCLDSEGRGDRH
jgi:tRNA(fMet)-specific endonuclease VapC